VARSAVGLAVRAGAAKPDIGSVEALRRTLLQAESIGYSDGPSGAYVAGLFAKLGIAEAVDRCRGMVFRAPPIRKRPWLSLPSCVASKQNNLCGPTA